MAEPGAQMESWSWAIDVKDRTDPASAHNRWIAATTLAFLSDWKRWVHRRVEHVCFVDPHTVQRRVSVDFTPSFGLNPDVAAAVPPALFIPLGLLSKRPLTGFSVHDETGRALPLLTSRRNGTVAAATLVAAATAKIAAATAKLEPGRDVLWNRRLPPERVQADLFNIGSLPANEALARWEHLGQPRHDDSPLDKWWRSYLVRDGDFMALATDLARNFLVLVPLDTDVEQRRILKFEYIDELEEPRRRRYVRDRWHARGQHSASLDSADQESGVGRLRVRMEAYQAEGVDLAEVCQTTSLLVRTEGTGEQRLLRFDAGACERVDQCPSGGYLVTPVLPLGTVSVSSTPAKVMVRTGVETVVSFELQQTAEAGLLSVRDVVPATTTRQRWLRGLAIRPKVLWFFTPSVGQAQSYHLEMEAPEGLQVTVAQLTERASRTDSEDPPRTVEMPQSRSRQRAHLHISEVEQASVALATIAVRARSTAIARASAIVAMFTSALLWIVWWRAPHVPGSVGSVVAILLLVPGGLSAYVARPREPEVTSSVIFGLRLLALSNGFWTVLAAAALTLDRNWKISDSGTLTPGERWSLSSELLFAIAVLCTAGMLLQAIVARSARRPPEHRARTQVTTPSTPDRTRPTNVKPAV